MINRSLDQLNKDVEVIEDALDSQLVKLTVDQTIGGTKTFSSTIYPELYKVLGTNQFAQFTHGSGDSSLPVGSIIHWLSGSLAIPDGYIE